VKGIACPAKSGRVISGGHLQVRLLRLEQRTTVIEMQPTRLVMGIGNESKAVPEVLERDFPSLQFAISDCWSHVQVGGTVDRITPECYRHW
jgi:hypothetical protein